jgi:hypothetical protein
LSLNLHESTTTSMQSQFSVICWGEGGMTILSGSALNAHSPGGGTGPPFKLTVHVRRPDMAPPESTARAQYATPVKSWNGSPAKAPTPAIVLSSHVTAGGPATVFSK